MKLYREKEQSNEYSATGGFIQKIKYHKNGEPYITYNGKHIHLNKFEIFGSCWRPGPSTILIDDKNNEYIIDGIAFDSLQTCYLIQLNPDDAPDGGEYCRVFYETYKPEHYSY